jgi:protein gp37
MNPSNIDWGLPNFYTWNPITGCNRGCSYCYARKIHGRFYKTPFTDIVEHEKRFDDKDLYKGEKNVFVGSMTDIAYWTNPQLKRVLDICKEHPNHTFLFLSKNADIYKAISKWPWNTLQGLTITGQLDLDDLLRVKDMTLQQRPFLSIEPLLGKIPNMNNGHAHSSYDNFEKIIVGAMTGPGAVKPKPEWIKSVIDYCPPDLIYWKPSMKPFLEGLL